MRSSCLRVSPLFVLLLCGWPAAPSLAQEITFVTLKQEIVEARVREAPAKNPERQAALRRHFAESGCEGERLTEQTVKGSRLPNVICTLPGATDSVIIVGAHFDKVDAGQGVADNWSGAVLLPSLFESLRAHPRRHTLIFVGFTDEEKGLVGSSFYARQMRPEDKARTKAMINLDTLGLSGTKVWLTRADKNLASALGQVAAAIKLPVAAVNVDQVGTTDIEPFVALKIPTIALHSVTQETWPILHSNRDTLREFKFAEYYDTYRLVTAYLAYLDTLLD